MRVFRSPAPRPSAQRDSVTLMQRWAVPARPRKPRSLIQGDPLHREIPYAGNSLRKTSPQRAPGLEGLLLFGWHYLS